MLIFTTISSLLLCIIYENLTYTYSTHNIKLHTITHSQLSSKPKRGECFESYFKSTFGHFSCVLYLYRAYQWTI